MARFFSFEWSNEELSAKKNFLRSESFDGAIVLFVVVDSKKIFFGGSKGIFTKKFIFIENIEEAATFTQNTLNEFLNKI